MINLKSKRAKGVNNFLIIRRDSKPEFTAGGLALPETTYVAPDWATVMVAPKKVRDRFGARKCTLKKGDRVFVRPMDGHKEWDLDKTLQTCVFIHVFAKEVNGEAKPLDHKLFIKKPKVPETKFNSIIILPESAAKKESDTDDRGTIVATGELVSEEFKVGMNILFDYEKVTLINKEENIFSLDEDCILGIFE